MATTTTPRTPGGRPPGPPRARDGSPPPHPRSSRAAPPDRAALPDHAALPDRRTRPRTRPLGSPRHTRPVTAPRSRPELGRKELGRARPRHPRAPFILLLIGLLGGALVCLLVISTTLAQGSYQITGLQQQNASLAKQEQLLTQQVAEESSPQQIAQEAEQLGMRPNPNLQFINTNTGKVVTGHPSAADTQIDVPGYTP